MVPRRPGHVHLGPVDVDLRARAQVVDVLTPSAAIDAASSSVSRSSLDR